MSFLGSVVNFTQFTGSIYPVVMQFYPKKMSTFFLTFSLIFLAFFARHIPFPPSKWVGFSTFFSFFLHQIAIFITNVVQHDAKCATNVMKYRYSETWRNLSDIVVSIVVKVHSTPYCYHPLNVSSLARVIKSKWKYSVVIVCALSW